MNFNTKLEEILKSDPRFVDRDGDLLKSEVIDKAWKIDRQLIGLLLDNGQIKAKFFDEIKGHWVFNINTFIDYVQDKNFYASSYTKFRNKIGLTIDGKFLKERGEVALVWPYKDCVLEGGQTKEEEKRKEIFFNEVLAQDEIDRLLDPKVLTNFKRYTINGEEKVTELKRDKDGTIRENLIIKGNNLLALHSLKEQFRGKIKLIYIDPPYNTGRDGFNYNDNFNRSSWLSFIKNRLEVCNDLLAYNGAIFIQISDVEQAYLKILCDEVFREENFVQQIIWKKRNGPPNDKIIGSVHEYILVYAKDYYHVDFNLRERTKDQTDRYSNPDHHPKGPWTPGDLMANVKGGRYVKSLYYPIENPRTGVKHYPSSNGNWRFNQNDMQKLINTNEISFGENDQGRPKLKRFLRDVKKGVTYSTIWDKTPFSHVGTKEIQQLFNNFNLFDTPKPEGLIKEIIEFGSSENDFILDFFGGSGTTAAVSHKMKRKWIIVEQMDYIDPILVERIKKVIGIKIKKGDRLIDELDFDHGGISKFVKWAGGGDFIYCELMKYNEAFIERIRDAVDTKGLLIIWEDMKARSFLNYSVDIQRMDENIAGFRELSLAKQKEVLLDILNKNQLYVNLSEIDDQDFKVSDEDKQLNKLFYKG